MSRVLRCSVLFGRSPHHLRGRLLTGSATAPAPPAGRAGGGASIGIPDEHPDEPLNAESEELRSLLAAMEHSLQEAERIRRQSLHEFQQLAVELAVTIAGELLFRAIEADQFHVEGLVNAAVRQLGIDAPITISLHPQDLRILESQPADNLPAWRSGTIVLRPDTSLPRGHCRAANGATVLLSELGPRLEEIREALWEGLDDAQIERRQAAGNGSGLKRFPDRRETA